MRFIIKKLHPGSIKGYYWKIEIELPSMERFLDFLILVLIIFTVLLGGMLIYVTFTDIFL